ncbi:MAG: hypothetical protein ACJ79M_05850 [Myxococcales bacterium]
MDEATPAAPPPISEAPPLAPKDHAEAVAIFRSEIVGALTRKELDHGELRAAFRVLSQERFRPPGIDTTRRYSVRECVELRPRIPAQADAAAPAALAQIG